MGEHRFIFWFNVIVGPLLGGFAAYFISASLLAEFSWCISGEEHCVREWVSALSGWAAFGAAALALAPVFAQVREAKRQTDFSVGDAPPEFRLARNRDHPNITLTITNWNRRRIMVTAISIVTPNTFQLANVMALTGENGNLIECSPEKLGLRRDFRRRGIEGWVDRSSKPTVRKLALGITQNDQLISFGMLMSNTLVIEVDFRILGQSHERNITRVSASSWSD